MLDFPPEAYYSAHEPVSSNICLFVILSKKFKYYVFFSFFILSLNLQKSSSIDFKILTLFVSGDVYAYVSSDLGTGFSKFSLSTTFPKYKIILIN